VTAAGLVRRTPAAARPTSQEPVETGRPVTRTTRSPEEVRRMLSRYRSGLDRGRTDLPGDGDPSDPSDPQTPGTEE
jgi:hypothetical protein